MLELKFIVQNMFMEISPAFPYQEGELTEVRKEDSIEKKYHVRIYFADDRGSELEMWFYVRPYSEELGFHPLYCAIPFSPEYSPIMKVLAGQEDSEDSLWQKMMKDMIELAEELLQTGRSEPGIVYRWTRDCL